MKSENTPVFLEVAIPRLQPGGITESYAVIGPFDDDASARAHQREYGPVNAKIVTAPPSFGDVDMSTPAQHARYVTARM